MKLSHIFSATIISSIASGIGFAQVQSPLLNPAEGESFAVFPLTITCATPDANIHYTLNGAEPTRYDPSIRSGGMVMINRNWTVKAKAWLGDAESNPTTGTFSVTGDISGGASHSLALRTPGDLWAWGLQTGGRLGNNTSAVGNITSPLVSRYTSGPIADARMVSAGFDHSVFLKNGGTVFTYGLNATGQLGDNSAVTRTTAVQVKKSAGATDFLTGCVATAAGQGFSLALAANGEVYTWGSKVSGRLGDGTASGTRLFAGKVFSGTAGTTPLSGIGRVAAAGGTGLAIEPATGNVWGWGNNASGQLGQGNAISLTRAAKVKLNATTFLTHAVEIAAAADHSAVVRWNLEDPNLQGRVFCFGQRQHGRLGNNLITAGAVTYPVQVVKSGGIPLDKIVSVATGSAHTLALDLSGNVWAWGYNLYGALGDNTTTSSGFAVKVKNPAGTGDLSNIVRIAAGGSALLGHSMAVAADGTVYTWGYNANGQLGNGVIGTTANKLPVAVVGSLNLSPKPPDVTLTAGIIQSQSPGQVQLTASPVDADNNVSRVDFFSQGQLVGRASTPPWQLTISGLAAGPHQVYARVIDGTGLSGMSSSVSFSITANSVSVDSDEDGLPNAWETAHGLDPLTASATDGADGDLDGDGFSNLWEYLQRSDPDDAGDQPSGMLVARDTHTLALTRDGRMWAWGYNGYGELGDGTTTTRNTPVPVAKVAGMGRIISVATGQNFSLALDEHGNVWGWGANNYRQISSGEAYSYKTPVRISLPARVVRIACGDLHSLASDVHGRLWSWGYNGNGQLGVGNTSTVNGFAQITKPSGMAYVAGLAASLSTSHAVDSNGTVWSWGSNSYGQIGDGTYTNRITPTAADLTTFITPIQAISSGSNHIVASAINGSIWTWGSNNSGQLGSGNTSTNTRPFKVISGLSLAGSTAAGGSHTLAVSTTGAVWTWGSNGNGQLGINSTTNSSIPLQTSTVTDWSSLVQVAGSTYHSVASKSDGSVWTWGYNGYGQLGHGDTSQRLIPTRLSNFKLFSDDSDADGLPDSWQRFYFENLTQTASTVYLANGVTNLTAYTFGLNPLTLDNDNDGISDSIEIAAGLDPLDWSDASGDLDGDRIPNLCELSMGTSMTDPGLRPNVNATVAPGQSIQSAINASPANYSNPTWAIIQVQPGVYKENITLPSDKRILLIPASTSGIPEIQGLNTSATVTVYGESVVDGFRITHASGVTGYGVYSSVSNGRALWRIVNCLIHNNTGVSGGAGIYASYGRTVIAHCSVFNNSATSQGNGIYVLSNAPTQLLNSICWNSGGAAPQEISSYASISNLQSIVRDGSVDGSLLDDPLLNSIGFLTASSPARYLGLAAALAPNDLQGEPRGSWPDLGADHFRDSDGDALPDWLESAGVTSAAADNDGDRLSNLVEYQSHGTNPLSADTDGDGLNDGAEITAGTNPFNPDSDTDGMPDGWEVQYGLNPTSDLDALEDLDRDRIPNLFEFANWTIPNNATSIPAIHITVDPATVTNTLTQKKTIQAAVSDSFNFDRHTIIRVKPGTYAESINIDTHRILLLGDLGINLPVISPTSADAVRFSQNFSVLDGFHVRRGTVPTSFRAFYVASDSANDQVRVVNSTISGFTSNEASAAYVVTGRITFAHCTIMDNTGLNTSRAIYVGNSGRLALQNSIIWNSGGTALPQIYQATPGTATALSSIILGGELGAMSSAPGTDRYHCLMPGSPALGAGTPLPVAALDRHNEPRPAVAPDIGADQRRDSDADGLPDWWEITDFGNLTRTGNGDHDSPQLDRLTNFHEYLLGFVPTKPDSWNNGIGDLYNAVFNSKNDPWYPAEWNQDPDGDGLTNGGELFYQTTPLLSDTNGDGLSDYLSIISGVSPLSTDTDGDGISNVVEIANGTSPLLVDSDGDGVHDNLDAFPLDPTRSAALTPTPGDTTPPGVIILSPASATYVTGP